MRRLARSSSILAALFCASGFAACGSDEPAQTVAEKEGEAAQTEPAVEAEPVATTRNTSRIDGPDPVEDAARVALATHPRFEGAPPVEAVVFSGARDWENGIAAAALTAEPLRAPILLSEPGSVPGPTEEAARALTPRGGSGPADAAAYAIGEVEVPGDLDATEIEGEDPAEVAAAIYDLRERLTGRAPEHIVLVSDADPAFAMPAAAWAARSGDPVLFVGRDSVPDPTIEALRKHPGAAVYLLGPPSVASEAVLREAQRAATNTRRIAGDDPVTNAIEFARYADASFGWNINDPGHGLVIANASRPADAAAAAPLAGSGTYGPLLLLESAGQLPEPLREFLLDIKPGYREDPTRALYNRIWLIGDESAISGPVQAEIDELAELAEIPGSDTGGTAAVPAPLPTGPAGPEREPELPAPPKGGGN